MIETEKATDRLDLPHAYDEVNINGRQCVCGRQQGAEIHNTAPVTEQASHQEPLQTEKGT